MALATEREEAARQRRAAQANLTGKVVRLRWGSGKGECFVKDPDQEGTSLSNATSRRTGLALAKFGQSSFQFVARKVAAASFWRAASNAATARPRP
jgi:hypothetical protein